MSTSRAPGGRRAALLHALVDDAAIFPPGNSPLPAAVRQHRAHRGAGYADAVGPLLVRASDGVELAALLDQHERLRLGLIVRPGADPAAVPAAMQQIQHAGRGQVVAVELPVADPRALRPVAELGVPLWLEVRPDHLPDDLDAVLAAGAHAKLRTGGLHPGDVPTEQTLAAFLVGTVARSLRFKLTAGLHHAVRGSDPATGLDQHGVANVLAGTAAALDGAGPDDVASLLGDRDHQRVAAAVTTLDDDAVHATRAAFASFGCCGVTDPLVGLAALGLADPVISTPPHPAVAPAEEPS